MNTRSITTPCRPLAALILSSAGVLASCGGGGGTSAAQTQATNATSATTAAPTTNATMAPATAASSGCTVGVAWNGYDVGERWKTWDGPAIKAAIEAGGGTYISNDALGSGSTQVGRIDDLIAQGADVVVIVAADAAAIEPTVASAISKGVRVIAYDVLIDDPGVIYMSFDNAEVGRLQAGEIFKAAPKGNYVIIKGDKADANSDLLRSGYDEVIGDAVKAGDIKVAGEGYTDYWDPETAKAETAKFLTAANNDVQAVLSENDGMAGGVVAALAAQGLAGNVPVSGEDGDGAALNRVALGTQTVSVWKDARALGKAAGDAAIQLCKDHDVTKVSATAPFTTPSGNQLTSVILKPVAITKDNLGLVLDGGWIDRATLCQGVTAGTVAACG
jgi:D-xylose transport system substrate-binding protein